MEHGIQLPSTISVLMYNLNPNEFHFADINGDGLMDIVRTVPNQDPSFLTGLFWINNGQKWVSDTSWTLPNMNTFNASVYEGIPQAIQFNDINGDGLPDLLYSYQNVDNGQTVKKIFLNNGHGWNLTYVEAGRP